MLVAAVMLAAAGGGIATTTALAAGHRVAVLAVARDVPLGSMLSPADLRVARVARDAALQPIPSSDRAGVLGQRAAVALRAGTLLTRSMLTTATVPAAGQALVAVAVKPGQLPARALTPGDRVLAVTGLETVDSPGSSPSAGGTLALTVADVGAAAVDGTVVVDVLAQQADATDLARQAAAGRVALVLLPPPDGDGP